jgi:hypothetical protein
MTSQKNLVNELFTNANREEQGDNRSYFVKALNKIIADGFITISIQEKGRIWTNPKHKDSKGNLKKFDVEIKGYGFTLRAYLGSDFDAKDVLQEVGTFIQNPSVSEKHIKSFAISSLEECECERCNGKGFIPQFNYYCGGICFECYGSKYSVKKVTLAV